MELSAGDTNPKSSVPVIGQVPMCKVHPTKPIESVCTAKECRQRILCVECLSEHERISFNHKTLVRKLNDWYKEFTNLKGLFDPAENYSVLFLLDQITLLLNKQREQIHESQNKMAETFQRALKDFVDIFKSLTDEMNQLLWKKQRAEDEAFEKIKKKLEQMSYKSCRKQIFDLMASELNFQKENLKEFFSKVYNGEYSNQVFDRYGGMKSLQSDLRSLRDNIEEGFRRFEASKFEEAWQKNLGELKKQMEDNFYNGIFQKVELDLFNPKNPKLKVVDTDDSLGVPEKPSKLVCAKSITTSAVSLCTGLADSLILTASPNRMFRLWDGSQNYRELDEIDLSNEDEDIKIKSLCTINFRQKDAQEARCFILLGGDDDYSNIEIWDYSTNKFLVLVEKAHETGISCIREMKSEYSLDDDSCVFYIATAACDNVIKVWTLKIAKKHQGEFDISMKLYKESEVHSEFISCLISLPNCGVLDGSVLISGSHDRSVNFWKWEEDNTSLRSPVKAKGASNGEESKADSIEMNKYHCKIKFAHSDFVKAIVLLCNRADSSDLEFFATGGGDNMLKVWSLKEKKLLKAFTNNKRPISKMIYLGNGKIATSANEKHIKEYHVYIWDWRTAQMLAVLKDHRAIIQNILQLQDGSLLTSDNKIIKIWKSESEEQPHKRARSLVNL